MQVACFFGKGVLGGITGNILKGGNVGIFSFLKGSLVKYSDIV
jgi:hypothetical protein